MVRQREIPNVRFRDTECDKHHNNSGAAPRTRISSRSWNAALFCSPPPPRSVSWYINLYDGARACARSHGSTRSFGFINFLEAQAIMRKRLGGGDREVPEDSSLNGGEGGGFLRLVLQ